MYLEQINLTNSKIRVALKEGNSKEVFKSTVELCKGDSKKANKLSMWFSKVAESCIAKSPINKDMSLMRMWQLGYADIKEVSDVGVPIFVLTRTGSEKIKATPTDSLVEILLLDSQKQPV